MSIQGSGKVNEETLEVATRPSWSWHRLAKMFFWTNWTTWWVLKFSNESQIVGQITNTVIEIITVKMPID